MRLILHACSAFLINSNDDQAHSFPDTSSHTPTTKKKKKPLTPFCFFVSTLLLFVILFSPSSLHLISSPVRLPSPSKFDSTESTKVCTRQVVGAFAGKHNGFYVCNSHRFKLNVLGWSVDCSPKRCLSFNMSVHEYCMAVRVEARVLGESLCTSG